MVTIEKQTELPAGLSKHSVMKNQNRGLKNIGRKNLSLMQGVKGIRQRAGHILRGFGFGGFGDAVDLFNTAINLFLGQGALKG